MLQNEDLENGLLHIFKPFIYNFIIQFLSVHSNLIF